MRGYIIVAAGFPKTAARWIAHESPGLRDRGLKLSQENREAADIRGVPARPKAYLPGAEVTLITKVVPPGRGSSIALRSS